MPIFNNEITFIHIPKCGGTSIEKFLQYNGYKMKLFTSTGSIFINGHTPQHCTYRELEELNLITDKVFTIIRPEIDRVVSEYFYIKNNRPDLNKIFNSFDGFLNIFLDKNNYLLFDYHNVSNRDFLLNKEGVIDEKIKIFDFFDIPSIEEYLGIQGLSNFHEYGNKNKPIELTQKQIDKIKNFYIQ
jgi:hypothetical protein